MLKNCIKFAKGYQDFQKYVGIQHVSVSKLHSVVKPWPFKGWTLDLVGEIRPSYSKAHKHMLVAIDYFTKWVKEIPLAKVDQDMVISFVQSYIFCRFGLPKTLTISYGSVFFRSSNQTNNVHSLLCSEFARLKETLYGVTMMMVTSVHNLE